MQQGNSQKIKAIRGNAIDRLRASGRMTLADEERLVRNYAHVLERGNAKVREMFVPGAVEAMKRYEIGRCA